MKLKQQNFIDFESRNILTQKTGLVLLLAVCVYIINIFIQTIISVPFTVYYMLKNPDSLLTTAELMENDLFLIFSLFVTGLIIILSLIYVKYIEKRPLSSTGLVKKDFFKRYGTGYLLGIVLIGLPAILLLIFGGNIQLNTNADYGLLVLYFLGFLIQGASEEIMIRGYLFTSLKKSSNLFWAIVISSLAFALLHAFNASIALLPIINLFLFGVFACFFFLRTKNIWTISAIHASWNFFQGNVFGIEVSGMVFKNSVFTTNFAAPEILSGGEFGLEGGLVVTIVLVAATLITIFAGDNKLVEKIKQPQEAVEVI